MSDVAEKTRPGPAAGEPAPLGNAAAILRGDHRPDLIRDEVLAEIFLHSAATRPGHPCLVDGARVEAGGVHPHLTYADVAARMAYTSDAGSIGPAAAAAASRTESAILFARWTAGRSMIRSNHRW